MANFSISATTLTFPDGTTQTTAAQSIPSGTKTTFLQAAAPTGWTQCTTNTNFAIRIVNDSSGGGTGGSVNFTTAFASQTPTGTVGTGGLSVGATTLTTCQIPSHYHSVPGVEPYGSGTNGFLPNSKYAAWNIDSNNTGGGGSHSHSISGSATFCGSAINLAVKYINAMVATKN